MPHSSHDTSRNDVPGTEPTQSAQDEAAKASVAHGAKARPVLVESATVGLFIIAFFTVLHLMAGLLVPIVAAVIVGSLLTRLGDRVAPAGTPHLIVGLVLVVLGGGAPLSSLSACCSIPSRRSSRRRRECWKRWFRRRRPCLNRSPR